VSELTADELFDNLIKDCRKIDGKDEPSGLRVIETVSTHDLDDADDIPMSSWTEEEPLPCFYIGAWQDGFNFLGNHEICKNQFQNPQRWFFVFNSIPDTLADVEKAIQQWAYQQ
jgi:hypothetical protein